MNRKTILVMTGAVAILAGCATMPSDRELDAKSLAIMKAGFKEKGQAKLDRLDQDDLQRTCSMYSGDKVLPKEIAQQLEKSQMATLKFPADGNLLGDWKEGEKIAQSGQGGQYSDNPARPSGANCYACHQLTKKEVSFGTIGPSLNNFGRIRGFTPEIRKYAYSKIYNSHAYAACSSMPRFGHRGILTEKQIKDLTALLMDPQSPVNQ
jgi:sulfur-oxidizing protein SoxX